MKAWSLHHNRSEWRSPSILLICQGILKNCHLWREKGYEIKLNKWLLQRLVAVKLVLLLTTVQTSIRPALGGRSMESKKINTAIWLWTKNSHKKNNTDLNMIDVKRHRYKRHWKNAVISGSARAWNTMSNLHAHLSDGEISRLLKMVTIFRHTLKKDQGFLLRDSHEMKGMYYWLHVEPI